MPQQQTRPAASTCPACGFRIFNRRYPKCERCKSDLPASLVYSKEERRALLVNEETQLGLDLQARALERRERQRLRAEASRQLMNTTLQGTAIGAFASTTHGGPSGTYSTADSFASGGGGTFDGGGASGSFGGDSGSSSGGGGGD